MVAMVYLKDKFDLLVIYQLIVFLFMTILFIAYIVLIIREKKQKRRNNNNNKELETEEVLHESTEISKSKKYCSIESTPEKVRDFDEKTKGFHYIDY
jgi:cbb3-type cytochrome oxidase subunit 3